MASFVSLSFSVPQVIFKEMPPWKLAKVTVVPRRAGTASTFVLSCCSNKSISMNWENCHPVRLTSRPFWGIVSSSSRNLVLAGYWVGPDVDDGWGYIEAFVDRIT
ncbi:uncharacterized protein LOC111804783 isoform X1 [Cucurbita pepo subsp. pepo]|uniref:uncharacterized protein LOC111804783 isoform X1 n=1 Tax=Cucurbita pepo subsp. pepo TaxID=3664 RepID=UPI000C9D57EA|nr:uncharacterized protein LOC111804783 isoform X1 [Cucurbita pepo subsp. pepo]